MILLLTGCINPNGMNYTFLTDTEERKLQYIKAIHFYLSKTNYPVVYTDNSGIDISNFFYADIKKGKLECISFQGNKNKERGKGYGECEIIQYALDNSRIIKERRNNRIAKITGRLIINNIDNIIKFHSIFTNKRDVMFSINSDFSFPDSRLIIASIDFYRELFTLKEKINDSKGYYFEHAIRDIITKGKKYHFFPFLIYPRFLGVSGSTGKQYAEHDMGLKFAIKYFRYTFSQLCKFRKLYN